MVNIEHYKLVGSKTCKEVLTKYPNYKVFWRSGFAYRGAFESEDNKQSKKEYIWQERQSRILTFKERMQRRYDWSAAIDIDIDHNNQEIHFNGFSRNDMY